MHMFSWWITNLIDFDFRGYSILDDIRGFSPFLLHRSRLHMPMGSDAEHMAFHTHIAEQFLTYADPLRSPANDNSLTERSLPIVSLKYLMVIV